MTSRAFPGLDALVDRLQALGCRRVLCKPLAENDNSKQQIYLGGSFEVLKLLPYGPIRAETAGKRQNFKTPLRFSWIDARGAVESAEGAQLILYPDYPEVRLSGFLSGCSIAPSADLRPLPKEERRHNNAPDGRVLVLGATGDERILAYLAVAGSAVSRDLEVRVAGGRASREGVFWDLPLSGVAPRSALLARLKTIIHGGWHEGAKLDAWGNPRPYQAQNGGGYTLEALFGIRPNGRSEPDFMGWELKAFSGYRITLMTPEPDRGLYGAKGVEAFVRKYGRVVSPDRMYFTGVHRVGVRCTTTGHTLGITGFDATRGKLEDIDGGIELRDEKGKLAAAWSFSRLIEHWGRKHASAAYVRYESRAAPTRAYRYLSPVLLGVGTDFARYLTQLAAGVVVYDPACKVEGVSTKPTPKARSQFRVSRVRLRTLYATLESVEV